jgi:116 kDa U5 small nuclear ribonucleoprotein component
MTTLKGLGISLKPVMYKMDVRPLLRAVLDQFFGTSTGLVDMVLHWVPSPEEGAKIKVQTTYSGPLNTDVGEAMMACDPEGPTVVHISKLYHTADAQDFRAFGRVMSGTVKKGMQLKVLGEGYSPEDEEDMARNEVAGLWISESRLLSGFTHYLSMPALIDLIS